MAKPVCDATLGPAYLTVMELRFRCVGLQPEPPLAQGYPPLQLSSSGSVQALCCSEGIVAVPKKSGHNAYHNAPLTVGNRDIPLGHRNLRRRQAVRLCIAPLNSKPR